MKLLAICSHTLQTVKEPPSEPVNLLRLLPTAVFATMLLRGPSCQNGSNFVFFYWRKVFFRVWLITCQKIMNLRVRKPPQNWGYAYIIGFHKFSLSKLWGRFFQLSVFPNKRFIKKNRTQSVFMLQGWLTYQNKAELIKKKAQLWIFHSQHLFL